MIRTLSLAALLLSGTPALLAAQRGGDPCPDARTQFDMNACAAGQLARADTVLNERYQRLLRALADEPGRVERLRVAQRAWIRFRDAHCDFEASQFEGGSMKPMTDSLCRAGLTEERAEALARMMQAATER
jgi:uncharacterized protein YecT (DUF1311 family)